MHMRKKMIIATITVLTLVGVSLSGTMGAMAKPKFSKAMIGPQPVPPGKESMIGPQPIPPGKESMIESWQ